MEYKNTVLSPVIIAVSLLLLSACAGNIPVTETPAEDTAMAATETAPEQAAEEANKDEPVIEVIPLDAVPAEATSATSADTADTADNIQQATVKSEETASPPQEVIPLPDIAGIGKKMLGHRNTLWHSRSATYNFYAGGLFATEYSPDKGTLTLRADNADSKLECTYTMDGKLDPQQRDQKKACSTLIKSLDNYLSN